MQNSKIEDTNSLFIMPRDSKAWAGSEALWITAAGFAFAGIKIFGSAVVATRDLIVDPIEVREFPLNKPSDYKSPVKSKYPFLPLILKTLFKDITLFLSKPRVWPFQKIEFNKLKFVWEQHDLFSGIGYSVARKYKVPYMIYVHGTVVWESRKWGVKRPFWGFFLEMLEAKSLKKADVVACVSKEVASQLIKMGVEEKKIKVVPMLVDTSLFFPKTKNIDIINKYNLHEKTIIGWTGSFRSFHGLEKVIFAFDKLCKENENVVLMLVGDGQLRKNTQDLVEDLALDYKVIFTGNQKFIDIPEFISVFDVAIVSANTAIGFHYSPLKLREYLACKKAVIAPLAGDLPIQFDNGCDVLFYDPDSDEGLYIALKKLIEDIDLRSSLESNGSKKVISSGTWYSELELISKDLEVKS